MKKPLAMLLSIIALFSLAACSKTASSKAEISATAEPRTKESAVMKLTDISEEPEEAPEISESTYYGTWAVVSVEQNGITATVEALEKNGNYQLSDAGLIICEDGTICLYVQEKNLMSEWHITKDGITSGNTAIPFVDDQLILNLDDGTTLYLSKISDDQTLPEPSPEPTAEPTPEPTPELSAETGLRPEFKEAMDSYEAFYTEYCDILKKYMNNPSDFSILGKYMELMGKVADMDAKFEAWEGDDLNNEELKYYLDVNNRVMKMLVDITG